MVPRGGRWELAPALDESSGLFGDDPVSVRRRVGPASMAVPDYDREAAIADLLTVRSAAPGGVEVPSGSPFPSLLGRSGGIRHYREARLEPGQMVTIVGSAQPYGQLGEEDALTGATLDDISIGADLVEAREAGLLAQSPEEAWGNAAIPGFGVGHPVRPPHLDAAANVMAPADARQASRAEQVFAITPETLVVSGGRQAPLVIYAGPPVEARARSGGVLPRPRRCGTGHGLGRRARPDDQRRAVMPIAVGLAAFALLVAVLVVFVVITTYNTVVALDRRADRAWANVDVALKQRWDEVPNLIAAIRGQIGFERTVLDAVTRLRAAYSPAAPLPEPAATSLATTVALRSLFSVVERYPELHSNENVIALQHEIERLETVIAHPRELFNEQIYQYNATISQVPAVFLAGIFGWEQRELFEIGATERIRPEVGILPLTRAKWRLNARRRNPRSACRRDCPTPPRSARSYAPPGC